MREFDLYVIEFDRVARLYVVPRGYTAVRCLQKIYTLDYFYYPDDKHPQRITDVRFANNVMELPKWSNGLIRSNWKRAAEKR